MWTTEHTAEPEATPEAVWAAIEDLHRGTMNSPTSDRFELHGPFEVGTELSVTPQGQGTFRSRIIELVPREVYADETAFGDITLLFRHTLEAIDGGTRVTHRLEISGPTSDQVGPELGAQISEDFPEAMQALFAWAGERQGEKGVGHESRTA